MAIIGRDAPVAKTPAVTDQHDTTYLFVIDGDDYRGCIAIMGIAGAIARLADG
jgi:hypothetical protein